MKKALITGITGQDGSYLVELLLSKGYEVYGLVRRSSSPNTERIDHILTDAHNQQSRIFRKYGDLTDASSLSRLLEQVQPDEIYNLGAQSHVRISFDIPEYTGDVVGLGTLRLLDAIKDTQIKTKFYQASSSEMFGSAVPPQNESTPFYPKSPYACAKVYAFWTTVNYRESYNLFACNGILFNHESPRRGINFVTRKITRGLSRIKFGMDDCLYLGNLEARRDWGYTKEYVEGMWLMLQHDIASDYVLATGESHSVREFVETAAQSLDFDLVWEGAGREEIGIDRESKKVIIKIDPYFFRPSEVDDLRGDYFKAKKELNWESKTKFKDLVQLMVAADFKEVALQKKYGQE